MNNIKVVSFDGDGTLWDFENAMRKSLAEVLKLLKKWFPEKALYIDVDTMIKIRNSIAEKTHGKFINLVQIRNESFREILQKLGGYSDERLNMMQKVYFKARFRLVEVYPDTVPTIKALKKRYKVGILSNGNTYPEKVGLKGLFDFTLYAEDTGVSKPDPRIYLKLLNNLDIKPEELLHIGDSLEHDILPAQKLGINTIFIKRDETSTLELPQNTTVIHDLTELLLLLNI